MIVPKDTSLLRRERPWALVRVVTLVGVVGLSSSCLFRVERSLEHATDAELSEKKGPLDAALETSSLMRNALVQSTPERVVFAESASDVADAVLYAKRHGRKVTVFATGHDYGGKSSGDGTVNINLSGMRWVRFVDDNRVSVGPGTPWHEVYANTLLRGRVPVGGYDSSVGIAGFTLGGGHGPLSRQYGLATDQLVSATIVDANGEVRQADGPDELWALRGGGGGTFGVAVDFIIETHPAPPRITQVEFKLPLQSRQPAVLTNVLHNATWWRALPRGWAGWGQLQCGPHIKGVFLYTGDDPEPEKDPTFSAFYHIVREHSTVKRLDSFLDFAHGLGSQSLGAGMRQFIGNVFVDDRLLGNGTVLTDYVMNAVFDQIQVPEMCEHFIYYNFVLGGQIADVDRDSAAVSDGFRDAVFQVGANAFWTSTETDDKHITLAVDLNRGLTALAPSSYINEWTVLRGQYPDDWRDRFWGDDRYARLLAVKRALDPTDLFFVPLGVGSLELASK